MYDSQCEEIFGTYDVDRAVEGLTDQIAQNAGSFPEVGATGRFRLGKTDGHGSGLRLRILFEILDENRVLLAVIRLESEEETFEGF